MFSKSFKKFHSLSDVAEPKQGLATADNMRFLRFWWELPILSIDFSCRKQEGSHFSHNKWFPCMKGGSFSKWIGNQEYIVNWFESGKEIQNFFGSSGKLASRPQNTEYYFREGITWSLISSKGPGFRIIPPGWIITHKGPGIYFPSTTSISQALAILNSVAISGLLSLISPTMGFEIGQLNLLLWLNPKDLLNCYQNLPILVFGLVGGSKPKRRSLLISTFLFHGTMDRAK